MGSETRNGGVAVEAKKRKAARIKLSVNFPNPADARRLVAFSALAGVSVSKFVRDAVARHIEATARDAAEDGQAQAAV